MKIAVPDTRISDCGLKSRRNKESGSASRARISAINRLPRHQVPMTVNAKVAAIMGNQPPSTTFNKLALKNNISTIANMLNNGKRSKTHLPCQPRREIRLGSPQGRTLAHLPLGSVAHLHSRQIAELYRLVC